MFLLTHIYANEYLNIYELSLSYYGGCYRTNIPSLKGYAMPVNIIRYFTTVIR